MATDTEVQTVTFESKGTHLRLIRRDAVVGMTAQGQAFSASEAVNIDFEPNGYVTFHRGEQPLDDGPAVIENGRPVYEGGVMKREVQDAISWLVNHREFGVQFHVLGLAPGTPLPLERDFIEAVMEATFSLNTLSLTRLREQELNSHGRPTLMAAVDNALIRATMERERLGDEAPEEADVPIPSGNMPEDLTKRPVGMSDVDQHARIAAGKESHPEFPNTEMANKDDPARAGGVPVGGAR